MTYKFRCRLTIEWWGTLPLSCIPSQIRLLFWGIRSVKGTKAFPFEAKEASLKALWKLRAYYPLQSQMWHTRVFWTYEKSKAITDLSCASSHLKLTKRPVGSTYTVHRRSQGGQGNAHRDRSLKRSTGQQRWRLQAKGNPEGQVLRNCSKVCEPGEMGQEM